MAPHAVYDETLERFVGSVHDTKGDAGKERTELAKTRQHDGHKLVVRDLDANPAAEPETS